MKEIRQNLNRHEFDLMLNLNKRLGTDFYLPKNTEHKNSYVSFMFVDCRDVWFGLV